MSLVEINHCLMFRILSSFFCVQTKAGASFIVEHRLIIDGEGTPLLWMSEGALGRASAGEGTENGGTDSGGAEGSTDGVLGRGQGG